MTEKRFEINNDMNLDDKVETYELSCIVDNDNKTFYFVVDSIANVESFVERLNELHEENEQLRKEKECDKQVFTKKQLHERLQQTRKENEQLKQEIETLHEENQKLKKLNIPIDEIKDTVSDYRGRIIGVYYND